MDLEFYRNLNAVEFERQTKLTARFDWMVTVFTTLCGLLGFLIMNFKARPDGTVPIGFWLLMAASGLGLAITLAALVASSILPSLEDIGRPSEWRKHRDKLDEIYKAGKGKYASAEEAFSRGLINRYVEAADANADINTRRGYRMQFGNFGLLGAFTLMVATFATYYSGAIVPAQRPAREDSIMAAESNSLICVPAPRSKAKEDPDPPINRPVPGPRPPPRPIG